MASIYCCPSLWKNTLGSYMTIILSCGLLFWRARIQMHGSVFLLFIFSWKARFLPYLFLCTYLFYHQTWLSDVKKLILLKIIHHNRLHQRWQTHQLPSNEALFFFFLMDIKSSFVLCFMCVYRLTFCIISHDLMKTKKCKAKYYFCYTCDIVKQVQRRTDVAVVLDKKFLSQIMKWKYILYIQG